MISLKAFDMQGKISVNFNVNHRLCRILSHKQSGANHASNDVY